MNSYKVLFLIAQKYVKGYPTFVEYYVNNIRTMYPDNSFIVIVDNNSTFFDEIKERVGERDNCVILSNTGECKFELGAYQIGMKYIIEHDLHVQYDYCVFSQDTFVLKNKFPFETLFRNNVLATPLYLYPVSDIHEYYTPFVQNILRKHDLLQYLPMHTVCWANSFVLHKSVFAEFQRMVEGIVVLIKEEACYCERFFGVMIYRLNGCRHYSIEKQLLYDFWHADIPNMQTDAYFVKKVTDKREGVQDILQ
jgi:hypothetical protein